MKETIMTSHNNYQSFSGYYKPDGLKLTPVFNNQTASLRALHFHHLMRATIESKAFPCVGAKAAFKQQSYRFGYYGRMLADETLKGLSHDLKAFAAEQKTMDSNFTTFVTCFDHTLFKSPEDFDDQLWQLLGALHKEDQKQGQDYDPLASSDPDDPHFAFSFAGTAYFVAALSPVSPRLSRQFVVPALIFNAHYQFEAMKQEGKFHKLRDVIRANDAKLEGNQSNDIAADFGDISEAVQYTGVKPPTPIPPEGCPYHKHYKP